MKRGVYMNWKVLVGSLLMGTVLGLVPAVYAPAEVVAAPTAQEAESLRQPHGRMFYLYNKRVNVNTEEHKVKARKLLIEGKDYPLALAELNLVLDLDKEDAEAFLLRGLVYTEMDKFSDADNDYREALRLEPKNPTFLYHRAYNFMLRYSAEGYGNEYDRAKAEFKEALKIEPYYIDAIVGLGDLYYMAGQKDKARSYVRRSAVKSEFQLAIDQYNKVLVLFGENDILKAKKEMAEQEIRDME
jgi:Flp pilus assembly protein TadD